jgi:hypothetical protein
VNQLAPSRERGGRQGGPIHYLEKQKMTKVESDPRLGIPVAQWSKKSTPKSRAAFVRAYDRAGSQDAQDRLHEDKFVEVAK